MDEEHKIPPLDCFLRNGGTFVVLRPVPDILDPERHTFSLEARRKLARVRKAAAETKVTLVLMPPKDRRAYSTIADPRWPRPVFLPELLLPPPGTREGEILNEAHSRIRNASLREYMQNKMVGPILTVWAKTAAQAVVRVLEMQLVHTGRIIICGGDPFIRLLAGSIVLTSPLLSRHWISGTFDTPPYEGDGFVIALNDTGKPEIKSLFAPRGTAAHIVAPRDTPTAQLKPAPRRLTMLPPPKPHMR